MLAISVGNILASMIVAGFTLGYVADMALGTQPAFMVLLGCLGLIGGMINAYQALQERKR